MRSRRLAARIRPRRRRSARVAPPGDVAVVERAERLNVVLDRRGDLARDERVPPVRADHDPALDVVFALAIAQPGPRHPAVLAQEPDNGRRLRDRDAVGTPRPPEQHVVERRSPDREAESGVAGTLGRPLLRAGGAEAEAPLPPQGRAAQLEHLVEDREPVEHRDEPLAAEEVRRDRGARKPHPLDEEHADPTVSQQCRDRRAGDPPADDDHVAGVMPLTHRESGCGRAPYGRPCDSECSRPCS